MRLRNFAMLLGATIGLAKQTTTDLAVTTYLADYNASNAPYYVESDTQGGYTNGTNNVTSILVANGYNSIVDGDWRLDTSASTIRTIRVTFSDDNAVKPGDPGYTAPAEPPYWGTAFEAVRMENECSLEHRDMLTMKAGETFTCGMSIRLPQVTSSTFYRLEMSPAHLNEPEIQEVQVSCNAADSSRCSDWFIDPIPVVNADGSTSPGRTRARLDLVNTHGAGSLTDKGDFYMTFHFHVTRP